MKHIFREYDIRGIYEEELNEKTVKAIGYLLGKKIKDSQDVVAVGYDARTHSPQITKWLISGLNKAKLKVLFMGLVPTPCNYFAGFTNKDIGATIMITGSHNPPKYNGMKITINKLPFFGEDLKELSKEVEENIEILNIEDNEKYAKIDTLNRYISYLTKQFKHLEGIGERFCIDCGNGAAGEAVERICKNLNLNVEILYSNPDGTFPNHHPDPSEEKNLQDVKDKLEKENFKLGFAFDGDGDRLGIISKKHVFKGDEMALMYAKLIKNPKVLGEVKCSQMMYDEIDKIGKSYMYKTGHSNIKIKMHEIEIDLAIEVSGHIFFNDRYFGYDDAIYAMLRTIELVYERIDLDTELAKFPKVYSTDELKIQTTDEKKFEIIKNVKLFLQNPPSDFPKIKDIVDIDGVRIIFEDGWGLIRASNTTPTLITRFESKKQDLLEVYKTQLTSIIDKFI